MDGTQWWGVLGSDVARLTEISWQCGLDRKVKFPYAVQMTESFLRVAQSIQALAGSVRDGAAPVG